MSLKIEFKGTFSKLCIDLNNLAQEDKQKIVEQLLQGSGHNNLVAFQQDMSIDIVTKSIRYGRALELISLINAGHKVEQSDSVALNPANLNSPDKTIQQLAHELAKRKQQLIETTDQFTKYKAQDKIRAQKYVASTVAKYIQEVDDLQKQLNSKRIVTLYIKGVAHDVTFDESEGKEYFHKQFPEIVELVSARNALGWPETMLVWGAAGSGKTHLFKQVGRALGVDTRVFCGDPSLTAGKLLGFNNVATGAFVKGWMYEPFKNGGLCVLDEAFNCDSSALVAANSMDNDDFMFGNGEYVKRHKDFYLVFLDNTIGTGSTKGFTRNVIDAATRDRMTTYELFYDEELEQMIYGHKEWAQYCQKVRHYVTEHMSQSFYVTSRAIRKGATYLKLGKDPEKIADWVIFKGLSKNIKESIIQNVGVFEPSQDSGTAESGKFIGIDLASTDADQTIVFDTVTSEINPLNVPSKDVATTKDDENNLIGNPQGLTTQSFADPYPHYYFRVDSGERVKFLSSTQGIWIDSNEEFKEHTSFKEDYFVSKLGYNRYQPNK